LRRHLGGYSLDILSAQRDVVRLELGGIRVVADGDGDAGEFLEGLDIPDPEFEDWLRDQRSLRASHSARPAITKTEVLRRPSTAPCLGLVAAYGLGGDASGDLATDVALDLLAALLLSFEAVDVLDFRATRESRPNDATHGPDWILKIASSLGDRTVRIAATLTEPGGRVLFAHAGSFDAASLNAGENEEFDAFVNRLAHVVLERAQNQHLEGPDTQRDAARAALGAIHQLFRMTDCDLDRAETLLAEAWETRPRSSYLAWGILVNVLRVGEGRARCDKGMIEKLQAMIARALEADAFNPLTLALAAQAHGFVFRDYASALDMSSQAVAINPIHAIAWDIYGLCLGYAGDPERGYAAALRARALRGPPVYQPSIETTCCILAGLTGRFDEGVRHGAIALARLPRFMPALRYAAACHGHLGRDDEAARLVGLIRAQEPDFSVARLRDDDYPVAGLLAPAMLEKGISHIRLAA
jgi:tetratricopeptide (TPR) repeat protein